VSKAPGSAPILSLKEVASRCAALKNDGKKMVLANGAFDVLHVGHLRYLEGAKAEGDILVVAINSDDSVRELKGASRPVLLCEERMALVAALRPVDFVTSFSESTVENVLRTLKPDVHAKGTDYTAENVPEREIVAEIGGRVAIVGDPKDHSTTELIAAATSSEVGNADSSAGDSGSKTGDAG